MWGGCQVSGQVMAGAPGLPRPEGQMQHGSPPPSNKRLPSPDRGRLPAPALGPQPSGSGAEVLDDGVGSPVYGDQGHDP